MLASQPWQLALRLDYRARNDMWYGSGSTVHSPLQSLQRPSGVSSPVVLPAINPRECRTQFIQHRSPFRGADRETIIHVHTESRSTWATSGDCGRCIGRMWWSQARIIWEGWLRGALAHAQALGSRQPLKEVQIDHYQPARGPYHSNLPRIHQHPY